MADVQELARQINPDIAPKADGGVFYFYADELERFAELVRAEYAQMCLETVNEGNYAYARACRDCAAATREGKS